MGLFDAVVGGIFDLAGAAFQNSATEGFQQANIDWQREQLQNKHQWEVEDLRKAGLNPILSATNGSSAVSAGSPQGAAVDFGKVLESLSHSSLMKKQEEVQDFQNQTERIKADADMIRAKQEEAKTQSAIGVNESTTKLNLANATRVNELLPMEKLYAKAKVDYTTQQIINSVIETQAKAQYYKDAGQAQLMMGSAAQSQAAAAWQNAQTQRMLAQTMEKNGLSQRMINDVQAGKYNQEIAESQARMNKILTEDKALQWQIGKDMTHNPIASGHADDVNAQNFLFGFGEWLSNSIGLGSLLK